MKSGKLLSSSTRLEYRTVQGNTTKTRSYAYFLFTTFHVAFDSNSSRSSLWLTSLICLFSFLAMFLALPFPDRFHLHATSASSHSFRFCFSSLFDNVFHELLECTTCMMIAMQMRCCRDELVSLPTRLFLHLHCAIQELNNMVYGTSQATTTIQHSDTYDIHKPSS